MPPVILQGCSICHLPEDHKCLGCNRYFCNCCGLSYHRDEKRHEYKREEMDPRPDPNDSAKYNECEKCLMRIPPAHKNCIYCKHDKIRPYVPKPPPAFSPERIEEMKRKYEDYENKWECDFCFTRMAHTEKACSFCKKDKDKPYINEVAIQQKKKFIRDLERSRIVEDLKSKGAALSLTTYPLKVGLKLTAGVAPKTDAEFQAILRENYNRWPGKEKYTIREFAIAMSHCTFNTSEHFCGINRNTTLRMLNRLPNALVQNLQEIVASRGADTLKKLFTVGNKEQLEKIGVFSVERPSEMACDYFAEELSGERPETVEMILANEFPDQPHIKTFIKFVLGREELDLDEVTIGDIQIALRQFNGNFEECKKYLAMKCPICTSTKAKHNMFHCRERPACYVCFACFDKHLELMIKKHTAGEWYCLGCGKLHRQENDEAQLKRLFKEFQKRVEASPQIKSQWGKTLDEKLKDYEISKNPNAVICPKCQFYQILNPSVTKITCNKTNCRHVFCRRCNSDWHEGKTCVQYFKEMGFYMIECPKCHAIMEEILGGCQHFDCVKPNCKAEFCSCAAVFYNGSTCEHFREQCALMGFHAHHLRNCYTFLRDMEVEELQQLIQRKSISYQKTCSPSTTCIMRVIKQDRSEGACGQNVYGSPSGLDVCERHYKLHLSRIIESNGLDRLDVMTTEDITILCNAHGVNLVLPMRTPAQNEAAYKAQIIEFVKNKWPLQNRFPTR